MGGKISIYMPAWNVARYIGAAIRSIIAQDMSDWTLRIFDDGSNDGTCEMAERTMDNRCLIVRSHTHNGNIGHVKNGTIDWLPDSEYVCHVGADDLIPPDCLSTYVRFMDAHPDLVAVCGTFDCFDNSGRRWMLPHVQGFKGFDRKILLKFMNFFPLRMYKRQALNEVRYSYELSSAVDYDLALRLDEKFPGRLGRLDMGKITYHYRQHGEQVSRLARTQQDINAREALQASLNRRQSGLIVTNSRPPFACVPREIAVEEHFIWNSK